MVKACYKRAFLQTESDDDNKNKTIAMKIAYCTMHKLCGHITRKSCIK